MKCQSYDETCECFQCVEVRREAAHERARTQWHPGRVTRMDAGGELYAPVSRSGGESGHTPSYDRNAIQKLCDQLNAREVSMGTNRISMEDTYPDEVGELC